ncbi:putative O-methyltransferase [Hypoxylon sp. NC1633]|nr:putative O-methyltransferase [Hypoxylon sp. NC1633]
MEGKFQSVLDRLEAFTAEEFPGHEAERLGMLVGARKLLSRLETNEETFYKISLEEPIVYAVLKTCLDIGLWRGWTVAGGGEKSLQDLATLAINECEINLLRRLLRLMSAANIIEETSEDRYKPTPFSLSIGDDSTFIAQTIIFRAHNWDIAAINVPPFLAKTSYQESGDQKNTIHSDGNQDGIPLFERRLTKKDYQDNFSGIMISWSRNKSPWPEFYDTESLVDGADLSPGLPLIVNVGGHHGVDLIGLLDKHPDLPTGSLILQDLASVISDVNIETDKIKPMAHNCFEVQLIYGSRAYFFRAIFHDKPDEIATRILRNIVPAMKKGYSKLLICDVVIPPTGASIHQAALDLNMMAIFSAHERTKAMWKKLLHEAGFDIIKVWKDPHNHEAMIEAELA